MTTDFDGRALHAQRVLRFSYAALLISIAAGVWVWPGPGREPNLAVFVVKMLPLLVFLPSVLRDHLRGLIWLCFVVQLYFAAAVISVLGPDTQPPQVTDLILSITVFVSAMLFVRWRAKADRQTPTGA